MCLALAVGEAQNLCSLAVMLLVFGIDCWSWVVLVMVQASRIEGLKESWEAVVAAHSNV